MPIRADSLDRGSTGRSLAWAGAVGVLVALAWLLLDRPIAAWWHARPDSPWRTLAGVWTELGRGTWTFIATAVVGVAAILWRRPQIAGGALLVAAAAAGAGILTNLIKVLVGRARPKLFLLEEPFFGVQPFSVGYDFNSFPSGHAATACATAAALWLLLPAGRWVWAIVGATVALTRVVVTAHFLGDVLAGGVLGAVFGWWLVSTAPRWWPRGWTRVCPPAVLGDCGRACATPIEPSPARDAAARLLSDAGAEPPPPTMPLARVEPRIDLPNPWGPVATPVLATIHRLLGLRTIERHLKTARSIRGASGPGHRFAQALSLRVEAEGPALRRIPRSGPLVVVCNHPLGGPDAIAAMALLERIRPDLRVIANRLLAVLEGLGERSFLVDPFGGPDAARRNVAALRGALGHLEGGGAIVVFPAGEVAHRSWRDWSIVEPPWSATIARLVERSGAAVLPLFVHGRNRLRFHLAGLLHPRLRTLLLPREMLHWEGRTVRVAIGAPIPAARLTRCGSADATIEHLRSRTLLLGERPLEPTRLVDALAGPTGPNIPSTVLDPRSRMPERIRPARPTHHSDALPAVPTHPISPPQHLEREIARLDPACTLLEHHAWAVVLAPAAPIPRLLEEIGRLRELAFRSVGEGSGKALDLDRFDEHYRHLFLWDRERRRVLGAYRVGCTDEILASQGIDGLYTRTLFEFGPQLLERMGPSLELGRSFVRPELQRHPLALLMLWKGIGRLLVQQPRYRRMFGPVSISREFSTTSHRLMVEFLSATPPASEFASLIQPRRPPRFPPLAGVTSAQLRRVASSLEELDEIVAEIEGGRLGVPVLVRQYLKLNAQLLGFNVDPAFHDVIDALMCVDLLAVDRRILRQYLGAEGAEAYRRHHSEAAELPVG